MQLLLATVPRDLKSENESSILIYGLILLVLGDSADLGLRHRVHHADELHLDDVVRPAVAAVSSPTGVAAATHGHGAVAHRPLAATIPVLLDLDLGRI